MTMFLCCFLFVFLSVFLALFRSVISVQVCPSGAKATTNLKELVIGKGLEYQIKINPGAFCDQRKDCNDIWLKFKSGFSGQSLCNVSSLGYQGYMDATTHQIPKDQQIFWENVYDLVHRYSDKGTRLITLEDTLIGYIADTLRFCGYTSNTEGIATETVCPSYDTSEACHMSAERAFWLLASKQFAEQAIGRITILLNATSQPVYSPNTYFASYEAPYLREGIVTDAKIILINENPGGNSDACSDSSLKSLFSLLENKGIHAICEVNPRELLFLYCAGNPGRPVCSTVAINKSPIFHYESTCLKFILGAYFVIAALLD